MQWSSGGERDALELTRGDALFPLGRAGDVRAGAAGGFVTVMVPDLAQPDDEMRRLYTAECASLHEVRRMLEEGRL